MDVFIMMTSGRAPRQPSSRLCLPHYTPPDIFPFLFPPRYPPRQSRIVICPLPSPPLPILSFSSLFCSCLGHNLPLSSDFFTSAPHATTAYQTSPITSQIFRSPHISLLNLASSPHLTLTSPPLASILFRVPRIHLFSHVLQMACHAPWITPPGQSVLSVLQQHLSRSTSPTPSSPSHLVLHHLSRLSSITIFFALSTKAVILLFGAFLLISSADVPSIIGDLS